MGKELQHKRKGGKKETNSQRKIKRKSREGRTVGFQDRERDNSSPKGKRKRLTKRKRKNE